VDTRIHVFGQRLSKIAHTFNPPNPRSNVAAYLVAGSPSNIEKCPVGD
jgi:hypothetical protein